MFMMPMPPTSSATAARQLISCSKSAACSLLAWACVPALKMMKSLCLFRSDVHDADAADEQRDRGQAVDKLLEVCRLLAAGLGLRAGVEDDEVALLVQI